MPCGADALGLALHSVVSPKLDSPVNVIVAASTARTRPLCPSVDRSIDPSLNRGESKSANHPDLHLGSYELLLWQFRGTHRRDRRASRLTLVGDATFRAAIDLNLGGYQQLFGSAGILGGSLAAYPRSGVAGETWIRQSGER